MELVLKPMKLSFVTSIYSSIMQNENDIRLTSIHINKVCPFVYS